MKFKTYIKGIKNLNNLTNKQIAVLVGSSTAIVDKWIQGNRTPPDYSIIGIKEILKNLKQP